MPASSSTVHELGDGALRERQTLDEPADRRWLGRLLARLDHQQKRVSARRQLVAARDFLAAPEKAPEQRAELGSARVVVARHIHNYFTVQAKAARRIDTYQALAREGAADPPSSGRESPEKGEKWLLHTCANRPTVPSASVGSQHKYHSGSSPASSLSSAPTRHPLDFQLASPAQRSSHKISQSRQSIRYSQGSTLVITTKAVFTHYSHSHHRLVGHFHSPPHSTPFFSTSLFYLCSLLLAADIFMFGVLLALPVIIFLARGPFLSRRSRQGGRQRLSHSAGEGLRRGAERQSGPWRSSELLKQQLVQRHIQAPLARSGSTRLREARGRARAPQGRGAWPADNQQLPAGRAADCGGSRAAAPSQCATVFVLSKFVPTLLGSAGTAFAWFRRRPLEPRHCDADPSVSLVCQDTIASLRRRGTCAHARVLARDVPPPHTHNSQAQHPPQEHKVSERGVILRGQPAGAVSAALAAGSGIFSHLFPHCRCCSSAARCSPSPSLASPCTPSPWRPLGASSSAQTSSASGR